MGQRLAERVALITGSSKGIGKSIAEAYAAEGAKLVMNARGAEDLEEAANTIRANSVDVLTFAGDVTDRNIVEAMVDAAIQHYGRIDILVNNAGTYKPAPFMQYTFEDFSHVVQTNIYSVFHVTQTVLKGMLERQSGRIINIASTAGKWGSRNQSAYNVSKHAIIGLTRCLALEFGAMGINVNAICPYFVETPLIDKVVPELAQILGASAEQVYDSMKASSFRGRFIKPEEVAHLAIYLASSEADYVNGQSIVIDGGYTMI